MSFHSRSHRTPTPISVSHAKGKVWVHPYGSTPAPCGAEMQGLLPESLRRATSLPGRSGLSSHYTLCLQITGPPTYGLTNTGVHIVTQKMWAQSHKSTQTLLLYTQTHSAHNMLTGASTGPHPRSRHTNTEAQRHTHGAKWHYCYQHSRRLKATQAHSHSPRIQGPSGAVSPHSSPLAALSGTKVA